MEVRTQDRDFSSIRTGLDSPGQGAELGGRIARHAKLPSSSPGGPSEHVQYKTLKMQTEPGDPTASTH